MDTRLKKEFFAIHEFIHTKKVGETLVFENLSLRLQKSKVGLRFIDYDGYKFIEQNPTTLSRFALMAKKGVWITWGIPITREKKDEKWIYLDEKVRFDFERWGRAIQNVPKPQAQYEKSKS